MDGKGGEWKALPRGDSQPWQPSLEHPGGSRSRTLVGALMVAFGDAHNRTLPTPHQWLLTLHCCYF